VRNRHIGGYLLGFCRIVDIHLNNSIIVFKVSKADAAIIIAIIIIPLVIAHNEWEVCDIPFKVSEQHLIDALEHLAIIIIIAASIYIAIISHTKLSFKLDDISHNKV
jgi:hypothetical protein